LHQIQFWPELHLRPHWTALSDSIAGNLGDSTSKGKDRWSEEKGKEG